MEGSRRLGLGIKKSGDRRRARRTNVEDEWQNVDFHLLAVSSIIVNTVLQV